MKASEKSASGNREPAASDLAGTGYWESSWRSRNRQRLVDPREPGVRNHLRRCFDSFFREVLGNAGERRLVEVGCADSVWLPYFRKELGFSVAGVDYSETGCEKAQVTLNEAHVFGEVYKADMFDPPAEVMGQFDVVFSYGLVEHFKNTAGAIRALVRFLKPGGLVVTIIPNMTLLNGALQRVLSREVYDLHVPLQLSELAEAHRAADLVVVTQRHLMSVNFGLLSGGSDKEARSERLAKGALQAALIACQVPLWWLEARGLHPLPPNRWTSPYLAVVAQRG